ncbi:hypothetical protein HYX02_02770 [Candidatus Woesearchaeota archaeon]|nr:hypothetical protein [Candidatus Woesearchaeota archaeon]
MTQNTKNIGYLLMGFSVILFVFLTIIKVQVDEQSAFLCEKFHENQLNMNECPVHKTNSFWANVSWMITAAYGIAALIFGTGAYLSFFYKLSTKELKKDFKEIDTSKLSDEEKKIYNVIKSKEGSAYQSDLMKETGFSKVKVTRILDKLESKDILERKRRGMTNIIVLK